MKLHSNIPFDDESVFLTNPLSNVLNKTTTSEAGSVIFKCKSENGSGVAFIFADMNGGAFFAICDLHGGKVTPFKILDSKGWLDVSSNGKDIIVDCTDWASVYLMSTGWEFE